jgi:hypothetical protein
MPELKSGILAYIFSDDDDMKDGDRDQPRILREISYIFGAQTRPQR